MESQERFRSESCDWAEGVKLRSPMELPIGACNFRYPDPPAPELSFLGDFPEEDRKMTWRLLRIKGPALFQPSPAGWVTVHQEY